MKTQLLVIAKAPVPGRVKTRLCPPCTPRQAAEIAAAALADTIAAATMLPNARRTIVLCGQYVSPDGWRLVPQRGDGLAERLTNGFADTAQPDTASVLIGMDTPQVTARLLATVAAGLADADAVLGPALDGGWWTLALRDPSHAGALREVPMSTPDTAAATLAALRDRGLRVRLTAPLRDVDTAADAWEVAAQCPHGSFAAAVRRCVPLAVTR
jgi:rSAM/selenodomain-associated transferase 1